uniref:Uncharacterized protein n=1 Tax=Cacopsylla melanoneura TaxID=428564 RepID=A0A8D8U6H8_9HEMI
MEGILSLYDWDTNTKRHQRLRHDQSAQGGTRTRFKGTRKNGMTTFQTGIFQCNSLFIIESPFLSISCEFDIDSVLFIFNIHISDCAFMMKGSNFSTFSQQGHIDSTCLLLQFHYSTILLRNGRDMSHDIGVSIFCCGSICHWWSAVSNITEYRRMACVAGDVHAIKTNIVET